jgi:hypothetical protein
MDFRLFVDSTAKGAGINSTFATQILDKHRKSERLSTTEGSGEKEPNRRIMSVDYHPSFRPAASATGLGSLSS